VTVNSRLRAVLYGAVVGGFLALIAFVVLGGRFALGAAVATPLISGSPRAAITFSASSGGTYLIVVFAGMLGGLVVAGITYAVARESEPEAPKFPLRYQLPLAALVSGITAYAALRGGIGGFADIADGVVTVTVFRMTLVILIAGVVAGAVTAYVVDRLARPELLGLEGEAWETRRGVMTSMTRAVGTPVLAVMIAGAFALGLSQVLLEAEGTLAVALFALAGALVLGGAVLLAYRPWDRSDRQDQPTA
jgi:hypothetical protein